MAIQAAKPEGDSAKINFFAQRAIQIAEQQLQVLKELRELDLEATTLSFKSVSDDAFTGENDHLDAVTFTEFFTALTAVMSTFSQGGNKNYKAFFEMRRR